MKLPNARTAEIIEQDLGKELLIYDLQTNKAYTLNETLMKVYRACNGTQTFDELKLKYRFTDDLIHLALDELQKNDLVTGYESNHFGDLSRRQVIRRVGLASVIALPVIAGLVAPGAAAAASVLLANNQTCTTQAFGNSTECQSGNCVNSRNVNRIYTLRCCALSNPANQGTTGFIFYPATDQADCDFQASFRTQCCSGAATYDDNTGTCTCT